MNPLTMLKMAGWTKGLLRHDSWSREQALAFQEQQLGKLRAYAYAHSPFYQRFHKGLYDAPLSELPVLDKATYMENWDDLVTDPSLKLADLRPHLATLTVDQLFRNHYLLNATSGSTGQPGLFLYDPDEWLWIVTSFVRSGEWAGQSLKLTHRTKVASAVPTVDWHLWPRVHATLKSWWTPEFQFGVMDPAEGLVDGLNAWQPEMLAVFPSVGSNLAAEQEAGRLRISPQRVFTGAEPLVPELREQMERVWGPCVYDHYAATEVGIIAAECKQHRGLHLQEDMFIAEIVDRDNKPVPEGELGDKVLVSIFNRRTLPLIRYELTDRVKVLPGTCPCGRPFRLVEIPGRLTDFIPVAGKAGGSVTIHPNTIKGTMARVPVRAWQFQVDNGTFRVLLAGVPSGFDTASVARRLNDAFAEEGAANIAFEVQEVESIPLGPTGKAHPVVIK